MGRPSQDNVEFHTVRGLGEDAVRLNHDDNVVVVGETTVDRLRTALTPLVDGLVTLPLSDTFVTQRSVDGPHCIGRREQIWHASG